MRECIGGVVGDRGCEDPTVLGYRHCNSGPCMAMGGYAEPYSYSNAYPYGG